MVISLACHQQKKSEVTSALVGVGSGAAELPLYEARKEYRSTSALAGLHSNTASLPEGVPCSGEAVEMWSCLTVGYSRLISRFCRVTSETRGHGGKQGEHYNKTTGHYISSTMFKGLILCNLLYWVLTGVYYQ